MAYCVFTNCLSILGSGITPYTSLDSRSGVPLTCNGQMLFVGSSDNSGPLGIVFQHVNSFGVCRVDITSTRYGISGNDLSLNVDADDPNTGGGLYIKYRGNVGIGMSSPCGALDVYKQGSGATGTGDNLILRGGNNNNIFATNQIRFGYAGGIGYSHVIKSRHNSAVNTDNALDFFLWNTTDAIETAGTRNVMTLTGCGKVGIGTCAPQFALHVKAIAQSDGLVIENACRNISCFKSTAEHSFMYIDSAHACVYQPAIFHQRTGITYSEYRLQRASSSDSLGAYTESEGIIGTTTDVPFSIQSCGVRRLFLGANGNIGINCITPSYRLHVNGTFYAAGSSQDYKQSICNYNTDSCMFMKLKPVTYQYKEEYCHLGKELKSGTQIGLIAEEVAETYPELAILVNEAENKVVRNVDYEKLSVILLSEVQKLRREVDDLKHKK